jgi:2,5-diketo-D-gluconate reductase A
MTTMVLTAQWKKLTNKTRLKAAANQVETHVFQQQKVAREVMQKLNTQIISWGPFAEGKNNFFKIQYLLKLAKNTKNQLRKLYCVF